MAPDSIPDMSDPAVLELVLCLLDVDPNYVMQISEPDGTKAGRVGEKFHENPPYILPTTAKTSPFKHLETDFSATWLTLTSNVDKIFSPALVSMPPSRAMNDAQLKQMISEIKSNQLVTPQQQIDHSNHRTFPQKNGTDNSNTSPALIVSPHIKMNATMYNEFKDSAVAIISPSKRKERSTKTPDREDSPEEEGTTPAGWGTFATPTKGKSGGDTQQKATGTGSHSHFHSQPLSLTISVNHTLCHLQSLSLTLSVTHTLCYSHPLSLTPFVTYLQVLVVIVLLPQMVSHPICPSQSQTLHSPHTLVRHSQVRERRSHLSI